MMTQQLGFSILSAPLAAIDRRALSQAWYSALHLARDAAPAVGRTATLQRVSLVRSAKEPAPVQSSSPRSQIPHRMPARESRSVRTGVPSDRRAPRSPLARAIERTFLDPARRVQRATFIMNGTSARVHVTLQNTAGGFHLVAVCSPSVRSGVTRALEEARYALASRGIALRIDVARDRA